MVDFKPYYWNPDLTNLLARETYASPVNSQTQTQSNKKMSGLYNHFRIDVDIYKFIVILGEDAKNSTWGYPIFIRDQRIYRSFRRSVCPSVHNFWKFWNLNFSALVQDRDLGFSRGHQSDDEEEDEDDDDDEEVKDDKDDNEEAEEDDKEEEDNYQTIKCLTFLESQAQAELNDDDDKDEEGKDDKDDNKEAEEDDKEAEEDDKEEDKDNYQTIKCLTFLESQAPAKLNDDDDKDEDEDVEVEED